MNIERKCQYRPLSKQPLALVLIQVRFSPIANIDKYVNDIQEELRKIGYSAFEVLQNVSFTVTQEGVHQGYENLWKYSTLDGCSNILLNTNQILFQTSDYTRFENFYDKFESLLNILLNVTQYKKNGNLLRYGLRYVDQIQLIDSGDTIDSYLNPGFIIQQPNVFRNSEKTCNTSIAGKISILDDKNEGNLIIRTIQGEKGLFLPPDLLGNAPSLKKQFSPDASIGIIDMDASFIPNNFSTIDLEMIKAIFYSLHDVIIESFFNSVVSNEGVRKWS